jgi:hypothetical protein
MLTRSLLVTSALMGSDAFTITPSVQTSTALRMGLFDGVKEAFSAAPQERSAIDAERETPIDRWMGWSVVSENQQQEGGAVQAGT